MHLVLDWIISGSFAPSVFVVLRHGTTCLQPLFGGYRDYLSSMAELLSNCVPCVGGARLARANTMTSLEYDAGCSTTPHL